MNVWIRKEREENRILDRLSYRKVRHTDEKPARVYHAKGKSSKDIYKEINEFFNSSRKKRIV